MTFNSSNREMLENETTMESLVYQIRVAMREGCISPCRVYDMVDEALDRLKKQEEVLKKAHDFLRKYADYIIDCRPNDARGIADDLWDAIHKGDKEWQKIHLNVKGN